jgi:hypothetical protein
MPEDPPLPRTEARASRADDDGIIRGASHDPAPAPATVLPEAPTHREPWEQWDAWCLAHARKVVEEKFLELAEIIGDELGKMLRRRDERIDSLCQEVATLRESIAGKVSIIPPKDTKGKSDAA